MRELIFNEACILPPCETFEDVPPRLVDMALGIASLIQAGLVEKTLRTRRPLYEYECSPGRTIWDAVVHLKRQRTFMDEVALFLSLAQKSPLLSELPAEVTGQYYLSDPVSPSAEAGEILVLCAHTSSIAVSLCLQERWSRDELVVEFDELDEHAGTSRVEENVDHLSLPAHAQPIIDRRRKAERSQLTPTDFWIRKSALFPNLVFGPDVEGQIGAVDPSLFGQVARRLFEIEEAAADWKVVGGSMPPWRSKTTPEGEHRKNDQTLMNRMIFASSNGNRVLFEWHARFGSGRIHLRFDAPTRSIEIGYIGRKIT